MEIGENLSEKGKKDLDIVNRAKQGDQSAYAELLSKHREPVYFMLLKMIKNTDDAEDLTIEAFGKAFNRINQYVPNYVFSTWLFKIAPNKCIDYIRKQRVVITSMGHAYTNENGESVGMEIDAVQLYPDYVHIQQQYLKTMRAGAARLKPRYKELIIKR